MIKETACGFAITAENCKLKTVITENYYAPGRRLQPSQYGHRSAGKAGFQSGPNPRGPGSLAAGASRVPRPCCFRPAIAWRFTRPAKRTSSRRWSKRPCFWPNFTASIAESIIQYLYLHNDEAAVRHLFTVASSLDSMVVGEPQILKQVKEAYQTAMLQENTGPLLHSVFQAALARSPSGGRRNGRASAPG